MLIFPLQKGWASGDRMSDEEEFDVYEDEYSEEYSDYDSLAEIEAAADSDGHDQLEEDDERLRRSSSDMFADELDAKNKDRITKYSFPVSKTSNGVRTNRIQYSNINFEDIHREISSKCIKLSNTLNLDPGQCLVLLMKLNWKQDRLLEQYMNCTSHSAFLNEHGVCEERLPGDLSSLLTEETSSEVVCGICYCGPDPDAPMKMFGLYGCKHQFCVDCYLQYIETKNKDENCNIVCPFTDPPCRNVMTPSELQVLSDYKQSLDLHEDNLRTGVSRLDIEDFYQRNASDDEGEDYDAYLDTNEREAAQSLYPVMKMSNKVCSETKRDLSICSRYWHNVSKIYCSVHKNKLKHCTFPDCENIVELAGFDSDRVFNMEEFQSLHMVPVVRCGDNHEFCFECPEGSHSPCPCDVIKKWRKYSKDESLIDQWLSTNTKDCPKCNSHIQKDGGCHHMQCETCYFNFCWDCLEDWKVHGYSQPCKKSVYKSENDGLDDTKEVLKRFTFYVDNFNRQNAQQLLDEKKVSSFQEGLVKYEIKSSGSWIETMFYKDCVTSLLECRQSLKWSYPLLFFLPNGGGKRLLELSQWQLTNKVDELSRLLDQVKISDIMNKKKKILLLTSQTVLQRQKFLESFVDVFADPANAQALQNLS